MTDPREDIIELLSFFADGYSVENRYIVDGTKVCEIVDYLMANDVTVQEWISVKDRLPEHKGNYLGFTGSTTMVGYYKGNGIWWVWLNDVEGENLFTHWMPLPQPPKGE